jgi:hypothetical protein
MAVLLKTPIQSDGPLPGRATMISERPVTHVEAKSMFEARLELKGSGLIEETDGKLKIRRRALR